MKKFAAILPIHFIVAGTVCLLIVAEDKLGERSYWPALLSILLMPIRLLSLSLALLLCKAVPALNAGLHSGFHSPPSGPLVYCFAFLLTFTATLVVRSVFRRRKA